MEENNRRKTPYEEAADSWEEVNRKTNSHMKRVEDDLNEAMFDRSTF